MSAPKFALRVVAAQSLLALILSSCASSESQAPFSTPYVAAWQSGGIQQAIATRPSVVLTILPSITPTATATPTAAPTAVPTATTTATATSSIPTAGADAGVVRGQVFYGLRGEYQQVVLGNATITLRQASSGIVFAAANTGANGLFIFQGIPPGNWILSAVAPDGLASWGWGGYQSTGCFASRYSNTNKYFSTGPREDARFSICMAKTDAGFKILTPANGSVFPALIVSWTAVSEADTYTVYLDDLTDPRRNVPGDTTSTNNLDFTRKLGGDPTLAGHCYLIRVSVSNGAGTLYGTDSIQACRQ